MKLRLGFRLDRNRCYDILTSMNDNRTQLEFFPKKEKVSKKEEVLMSTPQEILLPKIERIRIKNYRCLNDIEVSLTPLTCFIGPNGSGKTTLLDVFAFLSDCFSGSDGVERALEDRGYVKDLRTKGTKESIVIELKYRAKDRSIIIYDLEINYNEKHGQYIKKEILDWRTTPQIAGRPRRILKFENSAGSFYRDKDLSKNKTWPEEKIKKLKTPLTLAVNAVTEVFDLERVAAFRNFITSWYLLYLETDLMKNTTEVGSQKKFSRKGDNLSQVLRHLDKKYPRVLKKVLKELAKKITLLDKVTVEETKDNRLLVLFKDKPFSEPILSKYISDGTIKMLAYLILLNDPSPSPLIGIEEPENQLYPDLLTELAYECEEASSKSQIITTTHSPFFVSGLDPRELWFLKRNEKGYTDVRNASKDKRVIDLLANGALLGELWMEDYLDKEIYEGERER